MVSLKVPPRIDLITLVEVKDPDVVIALLSFASPRGLAVVCDASLKRSVDEYEEGEETRVNDIFAVGDIIFGSLMFE